MPNWVEQGLHVVGSQADVDHFVARGLARRVGMLQDDVLQLRRLCPLKRGEPKRTYTHESAVVLMHYRTRTQAYFGMITGWDYPAEFYARLAVHWPSLGFACSVNGEMGDFGGLIFVLDGKAVNLVRDYDGERYNRPTHARDIRAATRRWQTFLIGGRGWRVLPHAPWTHRSMPFDAHFDDDFWFYFESREEMARFRKRYRTALPQRLVDGKWRRTR